MSHEGKKSDCYDDVVVIMIQSNLIQISTHYDNYKDKYFLLQKLTTFHDNIIFIMRLSTFFFVLSCFPP